MFQICTICRSLNKCKQICEIDHVSVSVQTISLILTKYTSWALKHSQNVLNIFDPNFYLKL